MPTTLATILQAALRAAGITILPGTTPSVDQYGELIPATNRMMASYSLDGHRIYTADITSYNLVADQKVYTIGPSGDFNGPRPIYISAADIVFPTSPVVRRPLEITTDEKFWLSISVQDITAIPALLYYDGGITSSGLASIYLYPQAMTGYKLELATWLQLKSDFTATTDNVVLPPGYEEMMVNNLALRVAALYPREAKLAPNAQRLADESLMAVIKLNSKCPPLRSEAASLTSGRGGPNYGWWISPF